MRWRVGNKAWIVGDGAGNFMGDREQGASGERGEGQEGELRYGSYRLRLRGRALRLILWLAGHQTRINETAPDNGQIWLT
jgi:hypothetical protein